MADKEPVKAVEESDGVKGLLSIIEMLGDSMTVADRAKYDELLVRARAADQSK
jgi:hypothetical protein